MRMLSHKSKGFTLIELMVVMTILSVLAGIVVPAVTGTTTISRGTVKKADLTAMQDAIDRFVGDNPGGTINGYPTDDGKLQTTGSKPINWGACFIDAAGKIVSFQVNYMRKAAVHSGGVRSVNLSKLVSTNALVPAADITGIDLSTATTVLTTDKIKEDTIGTLTDGMVLITTDPTKTTCAEAVTVTPSTSSLWPTNAKDNTLLERYPVWRLDKDGKVLVVLTDGEY